MSLHHIPHTLINQEITSIYRILSPDGIFLLREHDLTTPYLQIVLDLIHSFYDLITKPSPSSTHTPHTPQSFRTYIAKYYSKKTLQSIIENNGFKCISSTQPIGLWRHYQAVYVKKEYYTKNKKLINNLFPPPIFT
jgi:hypothetical protein